MKLTGHVVEVGLALTVHGDAIAVGVGVVAAQ